MVVCGWDGEMLHGHKPSQWEECIHIVVASAVLTDLFWYLVHPCAP